MIVLPNYESNNCESQPCTTVLCHVYVCESINYERRKNLLFAINRYSQLKTALLYSGNLMPGENIHQYLSPATFKFKMLMSTKVSSFGENFLL